MPTGNYDRDYPVMLGHLFTNLGNLEYALRIALYCMDTPRDQRRPYDWRIANLNVGEQIEDCWLSGYSYLSELVDAFNARQIAAGKVPVDRGIVDLRNALAHGQISSPGTTGHFTLIKFGRKSGTTVPVVERHDLTYEWFDRQLRLTNAAHRAVTQRVSELR